MPSSPSGEEHAAEPKHFYGGQAVIEGVMMRAPDRWAVAARRASGRVSVYVRKQAALAKTKFWARWPLVRGNIGIYESIALGWNSLQTSMQIALEDALPEDKKKPNTGLVATLSGVFAFMLGIGLFALLPTWVAGWLGGGKTLGTIASNAVEGGIRLLVLVLYIAGVGFMPDIRRVFQYHGAEHAAINCFEAGETVTTDQVMHHSVIHPRCGTSFLFTVIVVQIVVTCFLGWPAFWLRTLSRIAVLPPVAALAYEAIYFSGRHRNSFLAQLIVLPGMALERLTTRRFDRDQAEVAIYALAAVAPEVPLPAELHPPLMWPAEKVEDAPAEAAAAEAAAGDLQGAAVEVQDPAADPAENAAPDAQLEAAAGEYSAPEASSGPESPVPDA